MSTAGFCPRPPAKASDDPPAAACIVLKHLDLFMITACFCSFSVPTSCVRWPAAATEWPHTGSRLPASGSCSVTRGVNPFLPSARGFCNDHVKAQMGRHLHIRKQQSWLPILPSPTVMGPVRHISVHQLVPQQTAQLEYDRHRTQNCWGHRE